MSSIPIIRGSFSAWQIAARERPTRKIKAKDVNIVINSSFLRRKADAFCDNCYHGSHQLDKRFGMIPGRHSFPFGSGGIIAHYKSGGKKKL